MFKFEKYQSAILGPSSSDSVATLKKKFGKTFSWVCMSFFLKKASKNSGILIKTINFTNILVILIKKNKFSVFKQKLVIQYNHIKNSTSF